MTTSTDLLFSPFTIKNFTLKNRIGVAPMTRMSAADDGVPRKDVLDFLVRRAENGAALVYTEAIVTDYESAQGYPGQSRITTQHQIDSWAPVVDRIRAAGSVAIMQLFHCGRMAYDGINPANRIVAPSPLSPAQNNPMTGIPYPVPEEMSLFDISHIINGFVESARGAIAAGFDGVEIHGAHGYLISQFLSSYSNQRDDAYGGNMENRFRFASETIRAVKGVVPENRLLIFRLSNWGIADMEVSLFSGSDQWQECIRLLSAEPLDALSISTYDFQQKAFERSETMAEITREATDLPLMICGKIHDRQSATLALNHADIALSAKSILLNPNFVQDLQANKTMPPHKSEEADIAYTDTPLP